MIVYFDCFSGAAGDMLLASLIDAGAPLDKLKQGLESIRGIQGEWELVTTRVSRSEGHIAALHVKVESAYDNRPAPAPASFTKDQESSSSAQSSMAHNHGHGHGHSHSHGHGHGHSHDHLGGPLRTLKDIRALILDSELPAPVKEHSVAVFAKLATAEAHTHGAGLEEVHFHEVGAVDSIVDTVGVVLALYLLGAKAVYSSPLPLGQGRVRTAHGLLPVPAPATLRLLEGVPTAPAIPGVFAELVTPTGRAARWPLPRLLRALHAPPDRGRRRHQGLPGAPQHRAGHHRGHRRRRPRADPLPAPAPPAAPGPRCHPSCRPPPPAARRPAALLPPPPWLYAPGRHLR
ncbi:unnamed protein product [Heterosigma akashiwo]